MSIPYYTVDVTSVCGCTVFFILQSKKRKKKKNLLSLSPHHPDAFFPLVPYNPIITWHHSPFFLGTHTMASFFFVLYFLSKTFFPAIQSLSGDRKKGIHVLLIQGSAGVGDDPEWRPGRHSPHLPFFVLQLLRHYFSPEDRECFAASISRPRLILLLQMVTAALVRHPSIHPSRHWRYTQRRSTAKKKKKKTAAGQEEWAWITWYFLFQIIEKKKAEFKNLLLWSLMWWNFY